MSATVQAPVSLLTPDATGNGYVGLIASTVRLLVPAFLKDVDGDWWGLVRIPQDYSSTPKIILALGWSGTSALVASMIVSTKVIANGASYNQALTAETVQDIATPTTAYQRTDATFTLSTTPVAGSDLVVKVQHNGARGADTATTDTLLFSCVFQYATA